MEKEEAPNSDSGNKFINLCPHPIELNHGLIYPREGVVARVAAAYTEFDSDLVCEQTFGDITGLPDPIPGKKLIVSAVVLQAAKAAGRMDCVAPATGHPDVVRNMDGQIISVPGFVK